MPSANRSVASTSARSPAAWSRCQTRQQQVTANSHSFRGDVTPFTWWSIGAGLVQASHSASVMASPSALFTAGYLLGSFVGPDPFASGMVHVDDNQFPLGGL